MARCFLLFCLFCVLSGANVQAQSEQATLRIAVDAPYPPFAEYDEKGVLTGFDVEISQAICKELNKVCDIRAVPFDSIIPEIIAGNLDMGVAGMGATEERKQLVDFTERYFRCRSVFIEQPGTFSEITPATVTGKSIAVQSGTLQEAYLREHFGNVATIVTVNDFNESMALLQENTVDLVLADGLPTYAYLKTEEGQSLEIIGEAVDADGIMDNASIAVSKDNPELREAINKALEAMRRNGEYGRINRKYFDFNVY